MAANSKSAFYVSPVSPQATAPWSHSKLALNQPKPFFWLTVQLHICTTLSVLSIAWMVQCLALLVSSCLHPDVFLHF